MTSRLLRLLIASNLLWLATAATRAQNADDFFNGGAQFYVSNNIPDALKKVESGRQLYPDDVKLKKLEELLKQQQQQQNQQNQQNQQQQQNQQSQSQQNQSSKNQQSQSQQQKNQQNQQQQPNQQAQNQQQSQQNQQQQQTQQQAAQNQQNQAQQAQQARAMTPEEAKHLLDAQKGNEQVLQYQAKGQQQNVNPPLKDW